MTKPSKRELIDQSIEGIFRLLLDIRREPGLYYQSEPILHALKSQGYLCALEYSSSIRDEQIKISPISLNTLKKKLLDNGPERDFEYLDKLRTQAQVAIRKYSEEPAEPKKRSRTALEDQVDDLKKYVSSLHATNMVLVQALEVNRRDLITILDTPNTGLRQKRINDAITRIIRIMGLNPAPFDDVTLLSTEKHLKLVTNEKRIVEYPESNQLFTPIPKLRLYDYLSHDEIITLDGNMMPFMAWPDGSACLQANAYMIKVRMQRGRGGSGPSRFGSKGGTFGEYAGQISHLIRFCYYNKLNFISLSDDDFCQFMGGLRREKKANNPSQKKRSERTLTNIGRRCLSFLSHVGEMNGIRNFVGIEGTISITMVDSVYYRNGKAYTRSSVQHRSFRTANAKRTRNPINDATIDKLRSAVDEMSTSEFLCTRRHLMISLFEEMGARRGEVQPITVAQVIAASKVKMPNVTINTLKRGGMGITRELELSAPLIDELLNYIRDGRRTIMKKFKGVPDHGFLFITERGGRPLAAETMTTEFSKIRQAAGIEEQACAHLFRHSFCTNIVSKLIAETQALSPESFQQSLMTNKMLAERAMMLTGHSTLESLLGYVDSAFKSKSKYEKVIRNVQLAKTYDNYEKRRKRLMDDFKQDKITKEQYIAREESLTKARDRDLELA